MVIKGLERLSSNLVSQNVMQKTLHLQLKDPGRIFSYPQGESALGNEVCILRREISAHMNGWKNRYFTEIPIVDE